MDEPMVEQLGTFLDGPWRPVRQLVRAQLREPTFRPRTGLGLEEHRARVAEQARALGESGSAAMGFPTAYGGGGDIGASVAAFETIALGDLSLLVKVGVQWGLFGGAVLHLGTAHHHERYLPAITSFALPGCFAMTETGHGSDVQSLRTTATYDPADGRFVVDTPDEDARKDYIGGAARDGRMAVVFAQLRTAGEEHGVHALLVPIRDEDGRPCPGVEIGDCGPKAGLNGVDNGRLRFDGVRVPRDALLDRYGQVAADGTYSSPIENRTRRFFTMVGTLVQGRVSIAGAGLSATKVALAIAVRYGLRRRQFAPPGSDREVLLLDYLQHQRRLLPAVARTYALHFAQQELVTTLADVFTHPGAGDRERRRLESFAAGLKARTTWHATAAIQTAREACGGAGYLSENRLADLKADTDVFTTFEGDNTVLLQLVTKGLLTDYRQEFGSLDTLGTLRFVADQVVDTVVEHAAPARDLIQSLVSSVAGREEHADLRDRGVHLELFAWREAHVLDGLARRLRRGIKAGQDPFAVFNGAQDHVLLAARASIDRIVLDAFVAAIARADAELRPLLARVCDLYALAEIEADRGWFVEHGKLSARRSKAVVAAVGSLCAELRPDAAALVDAWQIPESCLAPIALDREVR